MDLERHCPWQPRPATVRLHVCTRTTERPPEEREADCDTALGPKAPPATYMTTTTDMPEAKLTFCFSAVE